MTEVSDEFKNQSLNDISFKYDLQRQADSATVRREDHQWEVESKKDLQIIIYRCRIVVRGKLLH